MENLFISTTGSFEISNDQSYYGTAPNISLQNIIENPIGYDLSREPISFYLTDEETLQIERKMFENKLQEYLETYENKYIALFQGIVLDNDEDYSNFAKRVYNTYGYRPIYMPFVSLSEKQYRIATPKFEPKKREI